MVGFNCFRSRKASSSDKKTHPKQPAVSPDSKAEGEIARNAPAPTPAPASAPAPTRVTLTHEPSGTRRPNIAPDASAVEAMRHWADYGYPSRTPTRRVLASDWRRISPFKRPQSATWDQEVPEGEIERLMLGLRPEQMEEKWFVYCDEPDAAGVVRVHMHRSWGGAKMIELEMQLPPMREGEGASGAERGARFDRITWETDGVKLGEAGMKEMATEVCRYSMGVKIPVVRDGVRII